MQRPGDTRPAGTGDRTADLRAYCSAGTEPLRTRIKNG